MMIMRAALLVTVLTLNVVTKPAHAQEHADSWSAALDESDVYALADLMLGYFATAVGNTEQTIIDGRLRVDNLGEEGVWIYSQLNTGDELSLYRQRFHHLMLSDDRMQVIQRSYAHTDPDKFIDVWENPAVLARLRKSDLEPVLDADCAQIWTLDVEGRWRGVVDPHRCKVFSERRQETIRIGADSYYQGDDFGTSERGFDEGMNPIWGSAPGEFIILTRCRSYRCTEEARALSERTE